MLAGVVAAACAGDSKTGVAVAGPHSASATGRPVTVGRSDTCSDDRAEKRIDSGVVDC